MTAETSNARGEVGRFRKRPVVIEARQFFSDGNIYDLLYWINERQNAAGREFATWQNNTIMVPTREGQHIASPGDWIIRGVQGEFYPCKPDIFAATYEPADATPPPPADAEQRARELLQQLASIDDPAGRVVQSAHNGRWFHEDAVLRAIVAALAPQPAAVDIEPDCPHSALDGCDCYATQHQEPTT